MEESDPLAEEKIVIGKITITFFAFLPSTFDIDAFNSIYCGPWHELGGKFLDGGDRVLEQLVAIGLLQKMPDSHYGIEATVSRALKKQLIEEGNLLPGE